MADFPTVELLNTARLNEVIFSFRLQTNRVVVCTFPPKAAKAFFVDKIFGPGYDGISPTWLVLRTG